MGRSSELDGESGWSKEGADWFNSLSVEELVDIKWLSDYGVQCEEDEQKLEKLRESYEKATGHKWD
ncbi:hypothetical protein AB0H43_13040 [Hamadaea sp. NPDC050747]|uniref:hypothetical protein n=1 Tax=Hamadaea sp. NPDC050747 TaxID=3155789 RepID=UPI0033EE1648